MKIPVTDLVYIKCSLQLSSGKEIFPPMDQIFNAFNLTPLTNVKVVIVGQDPYHGKGQANGLSFSVEDFIKIPPSLQNIYKEINDDIGPCFYNSGNLEEWAKQGVLLLNTSLSVIDSLPGSHANIGWSLLVDSIIAILNNKTDIIFLLWGNSSAKKEKLINKNCPR